MSNSFWDTNFFDPPTPHVAPPSPKSVPLKLLPEIDRLFQAQRNSLRVLNDLLEVEKELKKKHDIAGALARLQKDAENTYRVVRSYLAENAPQ